MARESEIVLKVGSTAVASTRVVGVALPAARYSAFVVIAELTGVGGVTCDIVVEESWNNGADWFEVAHFTQLSAGAAASVQRFSPQTDATVRTIGKNNATTTATLAAGTICGGPWGPLLRLVSRTGAGSPSGGTITQTVRILQWQDVDGR